MVGTGTLDGKVVLVTGAARGIGAATARALAARAANVSLIGIEPELLADLAAELGERHAHFEADVTDQRQLDTAVAATAQRYGRIDVVVANAGVVNYGTIRGADPDAFARTVAVNLVGVYRTLHATVPHLVARKGYALVVASVASFVPLPGAAAYSASKAGVLALADTVRAEVAADGVEIGTAHPSWIDTDMVRAAEDALPAFREMRQRLPWPTNSMTSVQECAEVLADGIARRARRIYVPRSVAVIPILRPLLTSTIAEKVARRRARDLIARIDADVVAYDERAARRLS